MNWGLAVAKLRNPSIPKGKVGNTFRNAWKVSEDYWEMWNWECYRPQEWHQLDRRLSLLLNCMFYFLRKPDALIYPFHSCLQIRATGGMGGVICYFCSSHVDFRWSLACGYDRAAAATHWANERFLWKGWRTNARFWNGSYDTAYLFPKCIATNEKIILTKVYYYDEKW